MISNTKSYGIEICCKAEEEYVIGKEVMLTWGTNKPIMIRSAFKMLLFYAKIYPMPLFMRSNNYVITERGEEHSLIAYTYKHTS